MEPIFIFTLVLLFAGILAGIVTIAMTPCSNTGCGCAGSANASGSGAAVAGAAKKEAAVAETEAEAETEDAADADAEAEAAADTETDHPAVERAIAPVEEEDMEQPAAEQGRVERLEDAMRRARGTTERHVSGAALSGEADEPADLTDRVLELQRAASAGDAQAEAELDALLDAQVAGAALDAESTDGVSTTEATRAGMRANLPMTDQDEELARRAVEKSVPSTFYETEENRDARLKRARRMQALAEQDPDRSLEILQAVGTSGVKHPTRDTLRSARHKIHVAQMSGVEHEDVPMERSGRRRRRLDREAFNGMPLPSGADMIFD